MATFFLGAIGANMNRLAEIQTEHAHKTLSVDQGAGVANDYPKGLNGCNFNEILNFCKGM
jgi:hypothetical protein